MAIPATKAVRLSSLLVSTAEIKSQINQRSVPGQIEHWAKIGAKIAERLTPKDIEDLLQERADFHLERKPSQNIDLATVVHRIEAERNAGTLSSKVVTSSEWFETSKEHPGYIVKINTEGKRVLGKIQNGVFKPKTK